MENNTTECTKGYSQKNMHVPNDCYLEKLILQTESFIERLRWKVSLFESGGDGSNQADTKNLKEPTALLNFVAELYEIIDDVIFRNASKKFQDQMRNDLTMMKSGAKLEADKTANSYQLTLDRYDELPHKKIKVAQTGTRGELDRRANPLTDNRAPGPAKKKKNRRRKVLWYNPPFSRNVSTKIGSKFFTLLDKHFPRSHPLTKVVNRNNVKLSYCAGEY